MDESQQGVEVALVGDSVDKHLGVEVVDGGEENVAFASEIAACQH